MIGKWVFGPATGVMTFMDGEHYTWGGAGAARPADADWERC
jgi:hypothetical protein